MPRAGLADRTPDGPRAPPPLLLPPFAPRPIIAPALGRVRPAEAPPRAAVAAAAAPECPKASGLLSPKSNTASTPVKSKKFLRISPTCRLAPALANGRSRASRVILRPSFLALPSTSRSRCVADAASTPRALSPSGRPPSGRSLLLLEVPGAAAAAGSVASVGGARLAELLLQEWCRGWLLLVLVGSIIVCWWRGTLPSSPMRPHT